MNFLPFGRTPLRSSPSPPSGYRGLRSWVAVAAAPLVLGACASSAFAGPGQVQFNGSDGLGRAASAVFDVTAPGIVTITLTNTATTGAKVPADVLTGVFFDINNGPSPYNGINWDPTSTGHAGTSLATVASGSSVYLAPGVTNVSSEFAFAQNFSNGDSHNFGIASSGYGPFGVNARFDTTTNLSGPASPDGIQYGVTTAFDDPSQYNGGLSGEPLIKNSVVFTFHLTDPLDTSWISHVWFQYGTSFSEPGFYAPPPPPVVPEPGEIATGLIFGGSVLFALIIGRRRSRSTTRFAV